MRCTRAEDDRSGLVSSSARGASALHASSGRRGSDSPADRDASAGRGGNAGRQPRRHKRPRRSGRTGTALRTGAVELRLEGRRRRDLDRHHLVAVEDRTAHVRRETTPAPRRHRSRSASCPPGPANGWTNTSTRPDSLEVYASQRPSGESRGTALERRTDDGARLAVAAGRKRPHVSKPSPDRLRIDQPLAVSRPRSGRLESLAGRQTLFVGRVVHRLPPQVAGPRPRSTVDDALAVGCPARRLAAAGSGRQRRQRGAGEVVDPEGDRYQPQTSTAAKPTVRREDSVSRIVPRAAPPTARHDRRDPPTPAGARIAAGCPADRRDRRRPTTRNEHPRPRDRVGQTDGFSRHL